MKLYGVAALVFGSVLVQDARAQDLEQNLNEQVTALTAQVTAEGPRFMLAGTLEKGKDTRFSLNGEDFDVDDTTQIFGEKNLSVGQNVQASGLILDGKKIAKNVVVQEKGSFRSTRDAPLGSLDASKKIPEPGPVVPTE